MSSDDQEITLCEAHAKALDDYGFEALHFVGRNLKEWTSVGDATLDRLKMLWVEAVKPNGDQKTLETFGLWFSSEKLDAPWSLATLQRMLDEVRPSRPDHWIIERLDQLATEFPSETLRCLSSLYEHAESPLYLEHWWEHVMAILRAALSSEKPETKTKAIQLANIIGAKGLQSQNLNELRALVANT